MLQQVITASDLNGIPVLALTAGNLISLIKKILNKFICLKRPNTEGLCSRSIDASMRKLLWIPSGLLHHDLCPAKEALYAFRMFGGLHVHS